MNALLLPLPPNCQKGLFKRRVKRFSVEVESPQGNVWAHCNDSGSMLGLLRPGAPVLISPAPRPGRKLAWTLERIWIGQENGFWAGVNTANPNRLLKAAFEHGLLEFCKDYSCLKREARYGKSRLDALFTGPGLPDLWVECKSVSLVEEETAYFPDAPSERGRKHLLELMDIVQNGGRAAMFYLAQRADARCFSPADFIDPLYAQYFKQAVSMGVEMYVYQARFTDNGVFITGKMPVRAEACD